MDFDQRLKQVLTFLSVESLALQIYLKNKNKKINIYIVFN